MISDRESGVEVSEVTATCKICLTDRCHPMGMTVELVVVVMMFAP